VGRNLRLRHSFLPLFFKIEKYVFAFLMLTYPIVVLAKNNLGNLLTMFVLLLCSGLLQTLAYETYFDTAIVFIIYLVAFFGFKTFADSWKSKTAWSSMGLGFIVFVSMWICLELLAASLR